MMQQYMEIKQANPDCLLFYRMGDFYELFFDDAVTAAAALDITLTKRGRHNDADIPMCGVPVHSHETYLSRLIRQGFKVAVCEQTEDPAEARKRGYKAVVNREVVRLVTSGTITEEHLLDARRNNYLAALASAQSELALAWMDMSTGDFLSQPISEAGLAAALARLQPGELLLAEQLVQRESLFELFGEWRDILSPLPNGRFDSENGRRRLLALFNVGTLDAFGRFNRAELAAAGALVDYLELTQKGNLPRLAPLRHVTAEAVLEIDAATRRNLELDRTLSGARKGSLLGTIDRTVTGAGARLLAAHLAAPLTSVAEITGRQDMVQFFVEDTGLRQSVRDTLRRTPDMERALSRLTIGRGGPRDLAAMRDGLRAAMAIRDILQQERLPAAPAGVTRLTTDLGQHETLIERLARALQEELPAHARDGGFIAEGYAEDLDELRVLRDQSRRLIAGLEQRYRTDCGIANLKIRHNNMLGYYVEASTAQAEKLAEDERFIHRQTMSNARRFTTSELADLERRIGEAADKALALELALFDDLVSEVTGRSEPIALAAQALGRL